MLTAENSSLLFLCHPSFYFHLFVECAESGSGRGANAFQSVAGFSFRPVVDEDRERERESGECLCFLCTVCVCVSLREGIKGKKFTVELEI